MKKHKIVVENQKIFVKGKRIEFDALAPNLQEKLLKSWNIKPKNDGNKPEKTEPDKPGIDTTETKPAKAKKAKG